jgi:polysaccharide deacetylase family protein (PEP-CTERM system associated)
MMTTAPALPALAKPATPTRTRSTAANLLALTVDVEEYFHGEVFAKHVQPDEWPQYPRRAAAALERIGQMLERSESKATFFVLTWTLDYLAPLLRHLVSQGHEIASHGHGHQHLKRLTPAEFRADLQRSKGLIEDRLGVRPAGYRAPTFSVTRSTAWALDELIDAGFEYDASIFPIHHDRYGVPGAPGVPFEAIAPSGRAILELPPLTLNLGIARLPLGGGGYLRLLPTAAISTSLRMNQRLARPTCLYLHPWELDPDQPRLPASRMATWRHRVNLHKTADKLATLLDRFRFGTARSVLTSSTLCGQVPRYSIG